MITIFQHGVEEPSGAIGEFLERREIPFEIIRLYETNEVPESLPVRLIVLGGQMSVNDTAEYPFISGEKAIIRNMVSRGRPVWGICLGAQMIAAAFGQRVYESPVPEKGWCAIIEGDKSDIPPYHGMHNVFQWHNETFDLPQSAQRILQGNKVINQGFTLGSATGHQFHPEITEEIISWWVRTLDPVDRAPILSDTERFLKESRTWCNILTDTFSRMNGGA